MLRRITEDLETGEVKKVEEIPSFFDLPETAQTLIRELLLDDNRREFYRSFLGNCKEDFPLGVVYVEDPEHMPPLSKEDIARSLEAIARYQRRLEKGEPRRGSIVRYEQG